MPEGPIQAWSWVSTATLAPAASSRNGPLEFSQALAWLGDKCMSLHGLQCTGEDPVEVLDRGMKINSQWSETDLVDDPEQRRKEGWYVFTDTDTWADCNTPLHMAMSAESMDTVALLLSRGADMNICNARGQTILYRAVCSRSTQWVELLLQHCMNPDIPTVASSVSCWFAYEPFLKQPESGGILLSNGAEFSTWESRIVDSGPYPNTSNKQDEIDGLQEAVEIAKRLVAKTPRLPTRVIYVGKEGGITHLLEANGLRAPYRALAYCWGTKKSLVSTRASISSHLERIPVEALPKTPREAIFAARQLGFQYIWIDALCIIQDDEADWAREAATMQEVYYNARLVLCASDSDNCDGGLFRPRKEGLVSPVQLTVPIPRKTWPGKTCMYALPARASNMPRESGPVDCRAWTLQERLLSSRILYFGAGILRWECLSVKASETDPDGMWHATAERRAYEASLPYEAWEKTVAEYSSRAMTKPNDHITAILGRGRRMESVLGHKFIAGVWQGTFGLRSLCWHAIRVGRPINHYPSWSWASTTSPVQYSILCTEKIRNGLVTWHASPPEVNVETDKAQRTVQGSIQIKGMMRPAIKNLVRKEKFWGYNDGQSCAKGIEYLDETFFDSKGKTSSGHQYLIMASIKQHQNLAPRVLCMLLKPVDLKRNIWRRVGLCSLQDNKDLWVNVEQDRIISII
ncbi:hypothetical protein F5Y03DRAFT_387991 [Xylaria venustula]|nr:hypothetical protein F5Y03DRAFT_387991 [Xylaria venustula]